MEHHHVDEIVSFYGVGGQGGFPLGGGSEGKATEGEDDVSTFFLPAGITDGPEKCGLSSDLDHAPESMRSGSTGLLPSPAVSPVSHKQGSGLLSAPPIHANYVRHAGVSQTYFVPPPPASQSPPGGRPAQQQPTVKSAGRGKGKKATNVNVTMKAGQSSGQSDTPTSGPDSPSVGSRRNIAPLSVTVPPSHSFVGQNKAVVPTMPQTAQGVVKAANGTVSAPPSAMGPGGRAVPLSADTKRAVPPTSGGPSGGKRDTGSLLGQGPMGVTKMPLSAGSMPVIPIGRFEGSTNRPRHDSSPSIYGQPSSGGRSSISPVNSNMRSSPHSSASPTGSPRENRGSGLLPTPPISPLSHASNEVQNRVRQAARSQRARGKTPPLLQQPQSIQQQQQQQQQVRWVQDAQLAPRSLFSPPTSARSTGGRDVSVGSVGGGDITAGRDHSAGVIERGGAPFPAPIHPGAVPFLPPAADGMPWPADVIHQPHVTAPGFSEPPALDKKLLRQEDEDDDDTEHEDELDMETFGVDSRDTSHVPQSLEELSSATLSIMCSNSGTPSPSRFEDAHRKYKELMLEREIQRLEAMKIANRSQQPPEADSTDGPPGWARQYEVRLQQGVTNAETNAMKERQKNVMPAAANGSDDETDRAACPAEDSILQSMPPLVLEVSEEELSDGELSSYDTPRSPFETPRAVPSTDEARAAPEVTGADPVVRNRTARHRDNTVQEPDRRLLSANDMIGIVRAIMKRDASSRPRLSVVEEQWLDLMPQFTRSEQKKIHFLVSLTRRIEGCESEADTVMIKHYYLDSHLRSNNKSTPEQRALLTSLKRKTCGEASKADEKLIRKYDSFFADMTAEFSVDQADGTQVPWRELVEETAGFDVPGLGKLVQSAMLGVCAVNIVGPVVLAVGWRDKPWFPLVSALAIVAALLSGLLLCCILMFTRQSYVLEWARWAGALVVTRGEKAVGLVSSDYRVVMMYVVLYTQPIVILEVMMPLFGMAGWVSVNVWYTVVTLVAAQLLADGKVTLHLIALLLVEVATKFTFLVHLNGGCRLVIAFMLTAVLLQCQSKSPTHIVVAATALGAAVWGHVFLVQYTICVVTLLCLAAEGTLGSRHDRAQQRRGLLKEIKRRKKAN